MNLISDISVMAIDDPSCAFVFDKLMNQNISVKQPRSPAATHLVVIYDALNVLDVVGGALIRFLSGIVAVNQMFTTSDEHSIALVQFLQNEYQGCEIHVSVLSTTMDLYSTLGFAKRNRKGCQCGTSNGISHITWAPNVLQKPPVVAAIEKGITFT